MLLAWCAERSLDPLAARCRRHVNTDPAHTPKCRQRVKNSRAVDTRRPHLELYIRWVQEIRRFKPSPVSRRLLVTAGFYRTCVIGSLLDHSPAEHVRRPGGTG